MDWNKLWQARLGYEVKPAEAQIWESEIAREIRNPSAQEILAGVRAVADRKRMDKIKYRPGLDDLITAISETRKCDKHSEKRRLSRIQELINSMKSVMPDKNKAMNILCRCDDISILKTAEARAQIELGFRRPTAQEMGCTPSGNPINVIKNVSDEIKTRDRVQAKTNRRMR